MLSRLPNSGSKNAFLICSVEPAESYSRAYNRSPIINKLTANPVNNQIGLELNNGDGETKAKARLR